LHDQALLSDAARAATGVVLNEALIAAANAAAAITSAAAINVMIIA
jgi:hypothetical protein